MREVPKDVLKMASGLISPSGHRGQLCIAVGRNNVRELLVRGLIIMKSKVKPDLPVLSTEQWLICLK